MWVCPLWTRWILRCLILFGIALGFTVHCVSVSEKIGRLSSVPNYDDCVYMLAAKIRSFEWQQGGLRAVVRNALYEYTVHSPYSESLAMVAFAILGDHDRAPYQANIVVILAYLGILAWLLREIPLLPWLASLFVFLSFPIAKMGVVEFRPDIFWAIWVGFGAIYALTSPGLLNGKKESFIAGAIFAAAYLAKPSTFALTTVVLFASCGGRLFHAWLFRRESKVIWTNVLRSMAISSGTLVLLAGWYYLFFGAVIWDYFYRNSFGANKTIWCFHGSWIESMLFYINGAGASNSVGSLGLLVALFALALLVWRLWTAPSIEKVRCLLLGGIGLFIYIVNTAGGMKSQFVGTPLYMLAIFTTAYLLNCFALQYRTLTPTIGALTNCLLVFVLAAVLFFQSWPSYSDWSKSYPTLRYTFREATDGLTNILSSMESPPKSILFIQSGPVVPEDIKIWMLRHNKNLQIVSASFCRTIADFRDVQKGADMIVAPHPDTKGMMLKLPVTPIISNILEAMASDPEFYLYQTLYISDGGRIYVYVRKKRVRNEKDL